jgi:hypothetical protein
MIREFFAECSRRYPVSIESFAFFTVFLRDANKQLVAEIETIIGRDDLSHHDRLWLVTTRLREQAGAPRRLH